MKRILVLGTGGTIVSEQEAGGLSPKSNSEALARVLDDMGRYYDITHRNILNLDSSNIQMEEWQTIADHVYRGLGDYDGIVITHGTDTMAYTASVLTFMLRNLNRPVILTGSQLPLIHPMSDAAANLSLALAAVEHGINGVHIAFHHKIIRGCRAVKVRTMGFDAFESVNAPCVAEFSSGGLRQAENSILRLPEPEGPVQLRSELCNDVFLLKLIPGTNPRIFDSLLDLNYRGVLLEAFGIGGFHFLRRDLSDRIQRLVENNTAVVVCSQCLYEPSDFSVYEVGRRMLDSGAIPGRNMTTEAAVTKLMWALGQTDDMERIRRMFNTSYAGEVTLED